LILFFEGPWEKREEKENKKKRSGEKKSRGEAREWEKKEEKERKGGTLFINKKEEKDI